MSEFINTVDLLGDEVVLESILDKSIVEFKDNVITSVRNYSFQSRSNLTTIDLPNVTSIGDNSFNKCSNLTTVNLPNVTSIGFYAFNKCSLLSHMEFTNVTSISPYAFDYSGLQNIVLPKCIKVDSCFRWNYSLISVDFHCVTSITNFTFNQSNALERVIIRTDTLCSLGGTIAFDGTPIKNGTGYIYVPRALIDSYKTATNWSTYANQFRVLEDYTVDGTTTGELDTTKI